jgi:hypothetical protein
MELKFLQAPVNFLGLPKNQINFTPFLPSRSRYIGNGPNLRFFCPVTPRFVAASGIETAGRKTTLPLP